MRRWGRRAVALWGLLVTVGWAAPLAPGRAWGAEPVRVTATAFTAPASGGWTEILLILEGGPRPWRGVIEVAGGATKLHVGLALPARGQRVIPLPFWLGPASREPQLWIDGVAAGKVMVPAAGQASAHTAAARVLIGEDDGSAAPPGGAADPDPANRAPLGRWPETWRAYEAFDLVIVPAAWERLLRPEQQAALEQWVRWGGALGVSRAGLVGPPHVRPLGDGMALVGGSGDEVQAAYARGAATGRSGARLAQSILGLWERSRPWAGKSTWSEARPGRPVALALAGYLGLLLATPLVLAGCPGLRRAGLHLVLLLAAGAGLTVWGLARASGPGQLLVRELTLLHAQPQGGKAHVSTVVHGQALGSGTIRFVPQVERPLLYEAELSRGPERPHRAIRWDLDRGVWERPWAMGEKAAIRVDGLWRDLGLRVERTRGGTGWRIDNQGPHTLRHLVVFPGDGGSRVLPDLFPRGQLEVAAAPASSAGGKDEDAALAFWRSVLPANGMPADGRPALVASLDPPIRPLRFPDGHVRGDAETHLLMALPVGPGPGAVGPHAAAPGEVAR